MKPEYSFALAMLVPHGVLATLMLRLHRATRPHVALPWALLACIAVAPPCILALRPTANAIFPSLEAIRIPSWAWAGILACCLGAGIIVWRCTRSTALTLVVLAGCVVAPMIGALLRHGFSGAWYMRSEGLALVVSIAGWAAAYLPCVAVPIFLWLRTRTPPANPTQTSAHAASAPHAAGSPGAVPSRA